MGHVDGGTLETARTLFSPEAGEGKGDITLLGSFFLFLFGQTEFPLCLHVEILTVLHILYTADSS